MPSFGSLAFAPYRRPLTPVALQGGIPSHLASAWTPTSQSSLAQPTLGSRSAQFYSTFIHVRTYTFAYFIHSWGFRMRICWLIYFRELGGHPSLCFLRSLWLLGTGPNSSQRQSEVQIVLVILGCNKMDSRRTVTAVMLCGRSKQHFQKKKCAQAVKNEKSFRV